MIKQFNRYRISLLLTVIAFLLFDFSLLGASLVIDRFGLISSFPVTFFVSLGILTVAAALTWTSREKHFWLSVTQVLFLIISLYLTPFVLENIARFPAAYQNYGFVEYILRTGHFDPQLVWYHNWPGFPLLLASVFKLTGVASPMLTMGLFPTVMMMLYIPLIVLLVRNVDGVGQNKWCAIAWIFVIANWTDQNYFSPQAIAYLLLLCVLLLTFRNRQLKRGQASWSIVLIVLLASLTITHMITSIICLLMMAALYIVWRRGSSNLLLLFGVMIASWTIYGAKSQLGMQTHVFVSQAFKLDTFLGYTYSPRFSETSAEHQFINIMRFIFMGIVVCIGVTGVLLKKVEGRLSKIDLSFISIAAVPIVLIPLFVYGGEFTIRVFLMLLIPLSYFGAKMVEKKLFAVVLAIVLIVCLPLHFIAHYGNEVIEHIPPTEISASEFFYSRTTPVEAEIYQNRLIAPVPPACFQALGLYNFKSFSGMRLLELSPYQGIDKQPATRSIQYVYLSSRVESTYSYIYAQPEEYYRIEPMLESSVHYNLIYANTDSRFYVWQ